MTFSSPTVKEHPYIQKLLDAHVIGLRIDDDFDPTTGKRTTPTTQLVVNEAGAPITSQPSGTATIMGVNVPLGHLQPAKHYVHHKGSPSQQIRNYAIFKPYGSFGIKLFLHGRDIFTPVAAEQFYTHGSRDLALFKPEALQRIKALYLPDTFDERVSNYGLSAFMGKADHMKWRLQCIKEIYPQLDLSTLPEPTDTNCTEINLTILKILETQGIDLHDDFQEQINNTSPAVKISKEKVEKDMPGVFKAYLSSHNNDPHVDMVKARFAHDLRVYLKEHRWDWEILENFKAAANQTDLRYQNLEILLDHGATLRAQSTLQRLAKEMHNPYDKRFAQLEYSLAKLITKSVQPLVIKYALKDKTALLFSNSTDIKLHNSDFGTFDSGTLGAYLPSRPKSNKLSNFLIFSDPTLSLDLNRKLRHEFEHKTDVDGEMFAKKYKEQIPAMIAADIASLEKVRTFIASVTKDSSDQQKLFVLAKKAEIKDTKPELFDDIKATLLDYTDYVKSRIKVFALQIGKIDEHATYNTQFSQGLEIPAIMEELKFTLGRAFIGELTPQLAKATDQHRMRTLETVREKHG